MKIAAVLLCAILLFPAAGCGSMPVRAQQEIAIAPSRVHEDCMEIKKGERLVYSFQASQPLSFNLHYHDDSHITYAIEKENVRESSGTYRAEKDQYYCLMWTNPQKEEAQITYTYSVEK